MKLAVAIPMKPLARAKARLRPSLDDAPRQKLAADMLRHVLTAVATSCVAETCGVVSADPAALALAAELGCEAIVESAPAGYNQAAIRASSWAQARRCDALLILPADLPLLTPGDIRAMARLAESHRKTMVIAPDAREAGTNALLLRPPHILNPAFGPGSFSRHLRLARIARISTLIYHSATIAQDIDRPEDFHQFKRGHS